MFLKYMLAASGFVDATPIQTLTTAVAVGLKLALQSDFTVRAEIISAICSEGVAVKYVFVYRTGKTIFSEEKNVSDKE